MDINLDVCKTIAVQRGLPLQFVIKEFHLFEVLSQVVSITTAENRKLIFKGGTALNKIYNTTGQENQPIHFFERRTVQI